MKPLDVHAVVARQHPYRDRDRDRDRDRGGEGGDGDGRNDIREGMRGIMVDTTACRFDGIEGDIADIEGEERSKVP